ncbi:hypothetical protein EGLA_14440 [Enterococcus gallinarum]|nr:hypothetical protein AH4_34640 [Enterococcus gallinarum]
MNRKDQKRWVHENWIYDFSIDELGVFQVLNTTDTAEVFVCRKVYIETKRNAKKLNYRIHVPRTHLI